MVPLDTRIATMPAKSTLSVPNMKVLGKTREEVLASLTKFSQRGVYVHLEDLNVTTKNKDEEHLIKAAVKYFPSTHTPDYSTPAYTTTTGSYHTCNCGVAHGKRKLNKHEEKIVVSMAERGVHFTAIARTMNCSIHIVKETLYRYGHTVSRHARYLAQHDA